VGTADQVEGDNVIDVTTEQVFPLKELPGRIARAHPRADGRKNSLAAIYRWCQAGVAGVRLETVLIGGCRYTSWEAFGRFTERSTAARQGRPAVAETPRAEALKQAAYAKELDRIGI
jgi:hypothetical protein